MLNSHMLVYGAIVTVFLSHTHTHTHTHPHTHTTHTIATIGNRTLD